MKVNIVRSPPRRVATIAISERGEVVGDSVGYRIRLDARVSSKTILTYCTNGVLIRLLLDEENWLKNITMIIIDEIHEREKLTDFKTLCDAIAPELPRDETFNDLTESLRNCLEPSPSILANQHKFVCRFQEPGENIAVYARELKR